jgi:hypothetical protein
MEKVIKEMIPESQTLVTAKINISDDVDFMENCKKIKKELGIDIDKTKFIRFCIKKFNEEYRNGQIFFEGVCNAQKSKKAKK